MHRWILALLLVLAVTGAFAQIRSCYDIQYTLETNGNSPYLDQVVTVQGVVTGTGFNQTRYFISDAQGGPWSGLYIYNSSNQPSIGDLVQLTGTVAEYYNFTEITSVSAFQVLSQNNPLPPISVINTSALANYTSAEPWESVLIQVQNVSVTTLPNYYQEFYVTDGSSACQIDDGFFFTTNPWPNIQVGTNIASITGIVDYGFSTYAINPRSLNDVVLDNVTPALYLPNLSTTVDNMITVPLQAHNLPYSEMYHTYSFDLVYDPAVLSFQSVNQVGTLSHSGTVNVNSSPGNLNISCLTPAVISGTGVLLNFVFLADNTGVSSLNLYNAVFGSDSITYIVNGSVTVNGNYNSLGDTLTVIQRPILNVPAIHIPGETMTITCLAPQNTTGFSAWLLHGNKRINLPLASSTWLTSPNRWELQTTIPQVAVFELYDLEVNALGDIHDITQNAVQILPSRKSSYYFVHITDLHMPTRIYYPDFGFETDSLAVVDYRSVMDDINLIRPEFVLITGDLLNEGEMEGFANQYWFGWVQRLLSELEVPVYVTSGNHDIGGWDQTPAAQGSSRRSWWRYFGWSWLDNTDTNWPYHTQDYYFTYNNTVYIGLESYDNYDNWRWNIYGNDSFTDQQMNWLNATVNAFPDQTKVLFHHYDFQDELNLTALDLDMSLWGHNHTNYGSVSSYPYSLSTRSVCDGNRAYRVVRVANDVLNPQNTIYAGSTGNTLRISYSPSNYGVADSVVATITNGQPLAFENTRVKFIMPAGNTGYNVVGGTIEQTDRSGANNVCYVRVNLPAANTVTVSIAANGVSGSDPVLVPSPLKINSVYPNPLSVTGELEIHSDKARSSLTVELFNLKGQKVQQQEFFDIVSGTNTVPIRLNPGLANGIYYLRIKDYPNKPQKIVHIK